MTATLAGVPSPADGVELTTELVRLSERIGKLEAKVTAVLEAVAVGGEKEWYSTQELAALLGRDEFTVREWCRLKRIKAQKKFSGRGQHKAWVVSAAEVKRYQREGLLPVR